MSVPPNAGVYKIGNPYQIGGTWYYPREQPDYDETGIASWYGPGFYGHPTADGEIFDADALTAAHRTLPLPVNVRVTDLENGRSLILRVNDRGPFAKSRIIDVSARAAKLLGFYQAGTARVRVTYLARADLPSGAPQPFGAGTPPAVVNAVPAAPTTGVETGTLGAVPGVPVAPPTASPPSAAAATPPQQIASSEGALPTGQVTTVPVPAVTHLYIQVGAFSIYQNAARLAARLGGDLKISAIQRNGQTLYRVRSGPYDSTGEADAAFAKISNLGANDAHIVVDR
ncbi:MAG: septal ring lytic transglycosylase RlpA family protein [Alphaproteobacteria bacterium]|nr:septal ring lytic transglycosylase RlpA family protein [Alphaproteobacteria bacterium]MDE2492842.1 septal ring lytic transglycosylase RlpA family protein [Alphaproteobacteria bacterium]